MKNLTKQVESWVNTHIYTNVTMLMSELIKHCSEFDVESGMFDGENEYAEVMEWYIVDEYAYNTLKKAGEVVFSYADFNYFWGRQCTGQAIYMDSVIKDIALK